MVRVQRGEHGAFAMLVRRHTNMFFAAAYRMSGDRQESEDVVQEAFLKLWNKPGAFDAGKGAKFTTWFYRVVTNLAIDRRRKDGRVRPSDTMPDMPDPTMRADEAMQASQEEKALEAAIAALPDRQKAALNLCFYEGLSNREAAQALGIGVKALESLLMRAKAALKDHFVREGLLNENTYNRRSTYG